MKKLTFIIIIVYCLAFCYPLTKVNAYSNHSAMLKVYQREIEYEGITEKLPLEYVSPKAAFENIRLKYKYVFSEIGHKLGEAGLTEQNWKKYYGYILNNSTIDKHILSDLQYFFSTYQNTYDNLEIIDMISKLNDENREEAILEIVALLPSTSKIAIINKDIIKKNITQNNVQFRSASSNISAEKNYAISYAKNKNTKYPDYTHLGGDCTNFVSQILLAGGKNMNVVWNWNWGSKPSFAWVNANAFMIYHGTFFNTSNHFEFSKVVRTGDVIAKDFNKDGKWDHLGYVIQADSYAATYGGKYYYDYKVAQHSSNYIEWTSSNVNGWENGDAIYAISRHNRPSW